MPTQLPAGTNLSSPQIKLITDFQEAFEKKDLVTIGKHMHKDFRRSVYPRSTNEPEKGREDCLQGISGYLSFATEFDVGHIPGYSNLLPSG
jgi:hypothetical protein